jgi:hypothetical protein
MMPQKLQLIVSVEHIFGPAVAVDDNVGAGDVVDDNVFGGIYHEQKRMV